MEGIVKISFGLIVLNGYPFITYNLKSIYPFAHEIIVVEGACPSASNVATFDGHSIDGTLQLLYDFKNFDTRFISRQLGYKSEVDSTGST